GDISTDGVWTLPRSAREKGDIGSVRLPGLARDVIADRPQIEGCPFVFPGAAGGRFSNDTVEKTRLDASMRETVPDVQPWVHHDLRRTARSLMARAGVPREHAERVL